MTTVLMAVIWILILSGAALVRADQWAAAACVNLFAGVAIGFRDAMLRMEGRCKS